MSRPTLTTYIERAKARVEADPLVLFGMVGGAYALRANRTLLYALGALGAWWLLREPTRADDPAAPPAPAPTSPVGRLASGADPRLVADPRDFGSPDVARAQFEAWVRAQGRAAQPQQIMMVRSGVRPPAPGEW